MKKAGSRGRGRSRPSRPKPARPHRPTERLLDVLETFADGDDTGFTLAEMKARVGIPKSSLLLIVRTLRLRDYVVPGDDGRYRLTATAAETARKLWSRATPDASLVNLARPHLERLAQSTGETVFLAMPADGETQLVYVDRVESTQVIRYSPGPSERWPVHCTAAGKAYLASLPTESIERILATIKFMTLTPRTITDPARLLGSLHDVRKTGVAISVDEFIVGASAIASAVLNGKGKPVGACTAVGPTDRILAQRDLLAEAVRSAAAAISSAVTARERGLVGA